MYYETTETATVYTINRAHIEALLLMAGKKDIRYCLNGVYVAPCENGDALAVATDGHRLLAYMPQLVKEIEGGFVLPRTFLETVVKMAKAMKSETLTISVEDHRAECLGQTTVVEDTFLDWRRVLKPSDDCPAPQAVNPTFLQDIGKAGVLISGKKYGATLYPVNAGDAMGFSLGSGWYGVVMPMLQDMPAVTITGPVE